MDGQSEIIQALAVFGLINLVGEVTQDEGLKDLNVKSQVALSVGIPYLLSAQCPATPPATTPATTPLPTGMAYGGLGSIPVPIAILGALLLCKSRQEGGEEPSNVANPNPP